jgi:hypothetical protein
MRTVKFRVDPALGRSGAIDVMLTVCGWTEIFAVERLKRTHPDGFTYQATVRNGTSLSEVTSRLQQTPGVLEAPVT